MDAPPEVNGWDSVLAQLKKQPGATFDPQKGFVDPSTLPPDTPPPSLTGAMGYLNGEKLPPEMGGGNWQAIRQQALGGPAFSRVGNDWYQEGATPGPLTFNGAQAAGAAAMAPRETGGPGDSGYMSFNQMANLAGHDIRMLPEVFAAYNAQQQRRQMAESEAGKLDIERQKIAAMTDPDKLMAQSHANTLGKILERGGPNAANDIAAANDAFYQMKRSRQYQRAIGGAPGAMGGPAQPGVSPLAQVGAALQPGGMTREQLAAGGRLPPGSLASEIPTATPDNIPDLIEQHKAMFGPRVGASLNEVNTGSGFATPTSKLMTDLWLYDQDHPNTMAKYGPQFLAALKQNRGSDAMRDFADPNMFTNLAENTANLFNQDYSDTQKARAASRHLLGMSHPLPLLTRFVMPYMRPFIQEPHEGIAPIPNSPAAKAAALNALNTPPAVPVQPYQAGVNPIWYAGGSDRSRY